MANPAAGANGTWTVTAGEVWEIYSIFGQLACDANVANREIRILIANGATTLLRVPVLTAQVAGATNQFEFSDIGNQYAAPSSGNRIASIGRPMVAAGWTIQVNVLNIQVGDQLSSLAIMYRAYT